MPSPLLPAPIEQKLPKPCEIKSIAWHVDSSKCHDGPQDSLNPIAETVGKRLLTPETPKSGSKHDSNEVGNTGSAVNRGKLSKGRKLENFYSPNLPSSLSAEDTVNMRIYRTMPSSSKTQRRLEGHSRPCEWNRPKMSCKRLYEYGFDEDSPKPGGSMFLTVPQQDPPVIGHGGFGAVYIGKYHEQLVAVKVLKKSHNKSLDRHSFCNELNAISLDHENIVKILTFYCLDKWTEIVYEYVGPTNLGQLLRKTDETVLDESKRSYCLQIAEALKYCHSHDILHLDVKTSNVLICSDQLHCKLSDFGCSVKITSLTAESNQSTYRSFPGTMLYQSPEILRGLLPTIKSDVYSFGLMLWECVHQVPPFEDIPLHTAVFCVVAKSLRPSISGNSYTVTEKMMLRLAERCWSTDPNERPEFSQISAQLCS